MLDMKTGYKASKLMIEIPNWSGIKKTGLGRFINTGSLQAGLFELQFL